MESPHQPKICSFPPQLEKSPPPRRLPLQQIFIPSPPLNNNFEVITNKNGTFSCSHCFCSFFVLISYSLDTQVMLILILIDVRHWQKAVFSFDKSSNYQNQSYSGSLYPVKKFSPVKFPIPPTPYSYLENPDSWDSPFFSLFSFSKKWNTGILT